MGSGFGFIFQPTFLNEQNSLTSDFDLEDTIGSWYLITLLHIWMLLVRISEPGKRSEYFKRQLIKRLQVDLMERVSLLGVLSLIPGFTI